MKLKKLKVTIQNAECWCEIEIKNKNCHFASLSYKTVNNVHNNHLLKYVLIFHPQGDDFFNSTRRFNFHNIKAGMKKAFGEV